MHQDLRAREGRLEIGVVSVYDRGLFLHLTEQGLCPVWLRNAAVRGDRGALCGPYVTTGCLEAAHRAGASDGTLPTCVTVTSDA